VQTLCVPKLLAIATCGREEAAVEATGALAMITSTVSGKQSLLQHVDPADLFKLAGSGSMLLQRNVLNIISNAAENPEMRQKLNVRASLHSLGFSSSSPRQLSDTKHASTVQDAGVMELLSRRQLSASDTINRAVQTALQQCAFKHRPHVAPNIQGSEAFVS
jgi:hypothetical protein